MTWTTLVGSGAIVEHDGRVLMVKQRRAYGVHWELPGGYYDPGESLEAAAAREVLEEANVRVEVGPLVCTMVWERKADRRRNVLTWFGAAVTGDAPEPRPQVEEDIDAAAFLDPAEVADEIHPLEKAVLDRWLPERVTGFHIHAEVLVREDGTQDYVFRS